MPALVSPGSSVSVTNESMYVAATANTVPLFFIATRADKKKADNVTPAPGALETGVVRTITSLSQLVDTYGIPYFRQDNLGNELHGDSRNEYGLFAVSKYLSQGNKAYVVRANVDLADTAVTTYTAGTPAFVGAGNGTLTAVTVNQSTAVAETWTITATSATTFSVTGFVSGVQTVATVGTPYNNGKIAFTLTAGLTPFAVADVFTIAVTASVGVAPLGIDDAAKRTTIVTALNALINSNQDVRSDIYEYNLILTPGYSEAVTAMVSLNLTLNNEAFVIGETPLTLTPDATATWAATVARVQSESLAYYYPHGLASNLDGRSVFIPASSIALSTYTFSDNVSEVWYPPAGFRRGVVTGVTNIGYVTGTLGSATTFVQAPLNQGQRDTLYAQTACINPITLFPGRGISVFGQKTSVAIASALDRVNTVRALNKIKRDLRKLSMPFLFELNDRATRDALKQAFDDYLNDIMIRRGLSDFLVIIDASNNTPTRIDTNQLYADVLLKLTKAAEFIIIPIRVLSTGASM
jgi:phage tail sheath protein FI